MIFELVKDFAAVLEAMPEQHPRWRMLKLLDEAIRRDAHFIDRHPTTLFQCLWNSCWWYDCPDAAKRYELPKEGWPPQGPPWERPGPKLCDLLEDLRRRKEEQTPDFRWARSLRPPADPLGYARRAVLTGHEGPVKGIAFAPDGRTLASVSDDRTLRIWDFESGRELTRSEQQGPLSCIAYSPDGRRIATGSSRPPGTSDATETVRIWDAGSLLSFRELKVSPELRAEENAEILRRFPYFEKRERLPEGAFRSARCLAFSADGRRLATGGSFSSVWLWDVEQGDYLGSRGELQFKVEDIAFSADGRYLAACGYHDGIVCVWDATSDRLLFRLSQLTGQLYQPRPVRSDGSYSYSMATVDSLAFSPDGRWLATGSRDLVRVWDLETQSSVAELETGHKDVGCVAFSPDGRYVAFGETDQHRIHNLAVRVWEWRSGTATALYGHEGRITSVAFASDAETVASCAEDGTIRIWEIGSGEQPPELPDRRQPVTAVQFSPDGTRLVSDGQLWDTDTALPLPDGSRRTRSLEFRSASFSADGRLLAMGGEDDSIELRDTITGETVARLRPKTRRVLDFPLPGKRWTILSCPIRSTAFDWEGRRLAAIDYDGNVRIWDVSTGEEIAWVPNRDPGIAWPVRYERTGALTAATPTWRIACVTESEGRRYDVLEVAGEPWAVLRPAEADGPPLSRESSYTAWSPHPGSIAIWFPALFDPADVRWDGTRLAGAVGRRLHLYALEGVAPVEHPALLQPERRRGLLLQSRDVARPEPPRYDADRTVDALSCPRCGYEFDPRVLAETRQRQRNAPRYEPEPFGGGGDATNTITLMICRCGLELPIHWPSRIALYGIPVASVRFHEDRAEQDCPLPPGGVPADPFPVPASLPPSPPAPQCPSLRSPRAGADAKSAERRDGLRAEATPAARPLEDAKALLRAGKPREALDLLERSTSTSAALENAKAVCHLRLGNIREALELLRPLAGAPAAPGTDAEASLVYVANFATTLLLAKRIRECRSVLDAAGRPDHPILRRLRARLDQWEREETFAEKLLRSLGMSSPRSVILDWLPGEL